MQEALKNVAQNTVSGSITGGLKDPENFGRGALMGAAGGRHRARSAASEMPCSVGGVRASYPTP